MGCGPQGWWLPCLLRRRLCCAHNTACMPTEVCSFHRDGRWASHHCLVSTSVAPGCISIASTVGLCSCIDSRQDATQRAQQDAGAYTRRRREHVAATAPQPQPQPQTQRQQRRRRRALSLPNHERVACSTANAPVREDTSSEFTGRARKAGHSSHQRRLAVGQPPPGAEGVWHAAEDQGTVQHD